MKIMDFLALAKKRHSVRKYKQQPVEKEKLLKILEAGRVAPTAANRQPQRILVIQEKPGLDKAAKAVKTFDAPVILIVCGDQSEAWVRSLDNKNSLDIDTSIVTVHMMMQAAELGLGSVWMGFFDTKILAKEFQLPDHIIPVNILLIGYSDSPAPSDERHSTQRKPLSETVFYEKLN
jgi:nitroreductase